MWFVVVHRCRCECDLVVEVFHRIGAVGNAMANGMRRAFDDLAE